MQTGLIVASVMVLWAAVFALVGGPMLLTAQSADCLGGRHE
jgi:hypothetical protein